MGRIAQWYSSSVTDSSMLSHSRQKVTARGANVTELTPGANIFMYEWEEHAFVQPFFVMK